MSVSGWGRRIRNRSRKASQEAVQVTLAKRGQWPDEQGSKGDAMKGPDPILEGEPKGFPDGFNMG